MYQLQIEKEGKTKFYFIAYKKDGSNVSGTIEAETNREAKQQLRAYLKLHGLTKGEFEMDLMNHSQVHTITRFIITFDKVNKKVTLELNREIFAEDAEIVQDAELDEPTTDESINE